jgi:FSR family fosmidomycin resistance protein-like MFS transporter
MSIETISAVGITHDNRFQAGQVTTIAAAHAAHDVYTSFLPALLPAFIEKLALTTTQAGSLSLFLGWPSLLQPFIGHLADRVSLRYLVILAPTVTAACMSSLGLAPSYVVMALMLIVVGFSTASLHAVAPVMVGRLSGRNLGRGMGYWMVGGEVAYTIGPIVVVSAVRWLGLEGITWLMVAGVLASLVLFVRLREVPGRSPEAGQPLPWREAVRSMAPTLKPLTGIVILRAFVLAALVTYLPTFLTREGSDLWLAGAALTVFQVGGIAGATLAGSASDRLGRHWVLMISLATTAALMAAFLIAGGWLRLALLLPLGITVAGTLPVLLALVQESFPANRALAHGIFMAISFTMESAVVLVMGAAGDLVGLRLAYIGATAAPLLCLPLVAHLPGGRARVLGRPT